MYVITQSSLSECFTQVIQDTREMLQKVREEIAHLREQGEERDARDQEWDARDEQTKRSEAFSSSVSLCHPKIGLAFHIRVEHVDGEQGKYHPETYECFW